MIDDKTQKDITIICIRNYNDFDISLVLEPEGMVYEFKARSVAEIQFESQSALRCEIECTYGCVTVYSNGTLVDEESYDALAALLPVPVRRIHERSDTNSE